MLRLTPPPRHPATTADRLNAAALVAPWVDLSDPAISNAVAALLRCVAERREVGDCAGVLASAILDGAR